MRTAVTNPDRDAIEARQLASLERLLRAIIPANAFYTRKLAGADPAAAARSLESFRQLVPFTCKGELAADQAAHPPYGSNLTYPRERYTHYNQTSATTAAPLRWLDTPESWNWMLERWMTVLAAAGVKPVDRCYFAFSFGPFLGFWTAFGAAQKLGCLCIPGGGQNTTGRLRAILDNEVTVLFCTPTYAIHMLEVARRENIELSASAVRTIFVAGEPGGAIPATRQLISAGWNGAGVWDQYGMTEMGPVTFQCPVRTGVLHVMESAYIPEVFDPRTLSPAARGEHGELVLTNLGRLGSPLLRYRTGDLVCVSRDETCACGRSDLGLAGGILGRTDDMVVVRGVKVYPSAVEEIVRGFPEIAEYRVEIDVAESLRTMTLVFEPRDVSADVRGLAHRLDNALRTALSMRVRVEAAQPGTLQRYEMKSRRWLKRA